MKVKVHMPKLGMTMKKGTVVQWLKSEGDEVKKGEELVEIESEKITNTVEALETGILTEIMVKEGEETEISTVIAIITTSESSEKTEENEVEKEKKIENIPNNVNGKVIKEIKPLPAIRKAIGEKMMESLRTVPQGTLTNKVDVSEIIKLKNSYKQKGEKITITDLFVKIIGIALEENLLLNASVEDGNLIIYESINIGVGVPTDEAIYAPVIKNIQNKTIHEISMELKELVTKVKNGTISTKDIAGGTFTISNLGMFDVIDSITPIINLPERAILTIGATKKEPVVNENNEIEIKPIATLSLTVDHTIIDGIPVVKFMQSINRIIKNPKEYIK